jgi:hypothetical protein
MGVTVSTANAGGTYVPITNVTLTTTSSSVTLNLFSGYTDLKLIINAKNTTNGANCKYQFNGDTGSNYSTTWLEGSSTTTSSGRDSNATSGFLYYNGGANTNNWSTVVAYFQNYSNSSTYKTVIARFGNIAQTGFYISTWRTATNAAVTSITLNALTENFQIGSTFALYGIKAA